MGLNLSPGDLVEINSTGKIGMIIDLTPPATWGVLQFNYSDCKETRYNLKWLKYRSKISIAALDRKYFLNYYEETQIKKIPQTDVKFPKYTDLFIEPKDIIYSVGDLVTIRSSQSSFYYIASHPLERRDPELQALVLSLKDGNILCLVNHSNTYESIDRLQYNLPEMTKNWKSAYKIDRRAIIRKLSHYNLKKQSCLECNNEKL